MILPSPGSGCLSPKVFLKLAMPCLFCILAFLILGLSLGFFPGQPTHPLDTAALPLASQTSIVLFCEPSLVCVYLDEEAAEGLLLDLAEGLSSLAGLFRLITVLEGCYFLISIRHTARSWKRSAKVLEGSRAREAYGGYSTMWHAS